MEENKKKYEITYSCGHTGTVELFGNSKEREKKIANIEKYRVCPDCAKAANEQQTKAVKTAGLPDLKGTAKQITWADDLHHFKHLSAITTCQCSIIIISGRVWIRGRLCERIKEQGDFPALFLIYFCLCERTLLIYAIYTYL